MEKILVVGAHYDDSELGAGGAMAKWVSEGKKVYKLTLTDNVTVSDNLNLNINNSDSKNDSKRACTILGVKEVDFQPEPCCYLAYSTDIMQRVERMIFDKRIDTVVFHFNDDYNQDHIAAYNICKTAGRYCKNLLMYQSNNYIVPTPFYPTVFVDFSDFSDKKFAALDEYGAQHNRFGKLFETTKKRNECWGYANGCSYAEAFVPLKILL